MNLASVLRSVSGCPYLSKTRSCHSMICISFSKIPHVLKLEHHITVLGINRHSYTAITGVKPRHLQPPIFYNSLNNSVSQIRIKVVTPLGLGLSSKLFLGLGLQNHNLFKPCIVGERAMKFI